MSEPFDSLGIRGEVDLWNVPLQGSSAYLSRDEEERVRSFKFSKDGDRYACCRSALRQLLGRYLHRDPADLRFVCNEWGKPEVEDEDDLRFNVSHSGDRALIGFFRGAPIGVDVEKWNPDIDIEGIASGFFAASEQKRLEALPDGSKLAGFYQAWTSKESFIKGVGRGLSIPLHEFEVEVDPEVPVRLISTAWDEAEAANWTLRAVDVGAGYSASVAVRDPLSAVRVLDGRILL